MLIFYYNKNGYWKSKLQVLNCRIELETSNATLIFAIVGLSISSNTSHQRAK